MGRARQQDKRYGHRVSPHGNPTKGNGLEENLWDREETN